MDDLWQPAVGEMEAQGYDLGRVPKDGHLWADALVLFWGRHKRLPTAVELAEDMMDEWDHPASTDEAKQILLLVKGG